MALQPAETPAAAARAHPARRGAWLSFEFFPPRSEPGERDLWDAIGALSALAPDLVSITYGAGGSTRESSLATVRRIVTETTLRPMAHLTCVGASRAQLGELAGRFLDAGIRDFLALRGDPPRADRDWRPAPDGLRYAQQLISLLWSVAGARGIAPHDVRIAVAAFPGGHTQSGSLAQDTAVLAEKERLGASLAITQLFFYPSEYAALVERARGAGVTMPIVPGIMPMLSPARLRRMGALAGQNPPLALLAGLEEREGRERYEYGMAATERLARAVLDLGAPGLHLYTLNQGGPVLDLARRLGWANATEGHET